MLEMLFSEFNKHLNCCIKEHFDLGISTFNQKNLGTILHKYFLDASKMEIIYVSTYSPNYTRTESLISLFNSMNLNYKVYFFKGKFKYIQLLFFLFRLKNKNQKILFLSFRGHEIFPFVKLIWGKNKFIFDAFISIYDTLCDDRKLINKNSFIAKFLKGYDRFMCKNADVVLVDTKAHQTYFANEFQANNVEYLYVDCNRDLFQPLKYEDNAKFEVFWYGGAQPVHGLDIIAQVINNVSHISEIRFTLVGPIPNQIKAQLEHLNNVRLIPWVPYSKLPEYINKADLCLGGHFALDVNKAKNTIPGKVFQFVNCNRPTLIAKTIANQEIFNFYEG